MTGETIWDAAERTAHSIHKLVGMTFADAFNALPQPYTLRIVEIDGEPCVCTRDLNPTRINVVLNSEGTGGRTGRAIITEVKGLG